MLIGLLCHFNGNANPPLQLHQITKLISPSGELQAFKLTFGDFKHSYNSRPFSVVLSRQPNSTCPVVLLSKYLTLRGLRPGAIFVSEGGLPVSRSVFSSQLLEICPEMHTTTKMAKMAKFRQQQLGGQCK